MIFAANMLLLLALALFPGQRKQDDPHGFRSLADHAQLRQMLTEGRLAEFDAAVEGFVLSRLRKDLGPKMRPSLNQDPALGALLGLIQHAVKVAAFAAELKTLGPALGLKEAVRWVESGLIRRSGVKRAHFPSFFAIVTEPGLPEIGPAAMKAIGLDQANAYSGIDRAYEQLAGALVTELP